MNKEQALAEIEKLKAFIEGLGKPPRKWKPKIGEKYFAAFEKIPFTHGSSVAGKRTVLAGLAFKTKAEADYHGEMLEFADRIKEHSFEPDWGDLEQVKWCVVWNHEQCGFGCWGYEINETSPTHFPSEEIAKAAFKGVSKEDFLYMRRAGLI